MSDYVSTNSLSRIRRFTLPGAYIDRIGSSTNNEGGFKRSWGMSVATNGAVAVADWENSRVMIGDAFPAGWTLLVSSSVLNQPQDVAFDPHGYLCIADTGNHRILLLTLPTSQSAPASLDATSTVISTNGFVITWTGESRWIYTIQCTDSMTNLNAWMNVPGCVNILGIDGPMSCTDTTSVGVVSRFYRILAY